MKLISMYKQREEQRKKKHEILVYPQIGYEPDEKRINAHGQVN